jgi:hypothetical protein
LGLYEDKINNFSWDSNQNKSNSWSKKGPCVLCLETIIIMINVGDELYVERTKV